jgi:AraC family transcriptional activator of pobA
MDGSRESWYFSTMRRRVQRQSRNPPHVAFSRTKYGRELLLDAAFVRQMPTFLRKGPHVLGFHDILVVTRGRGRFFLDGEPHAVRPGVAFFTRPGQVREWRLTRPLDGACLFFTESFLGEAFSDPRFLDRFAFFAPGGARALPLRASERRHFLGRFRAMQREIARLRDDAPDALRALLYETLVALNRWYTAHHGAGPAASPGSVVDRFRRLVDRDFARRHPVAEYAAVLGLTPGHLNVLCRTRAGTNASRIIHDRITLEAKRLLLHTDLHAAEVAERLGFDDPSYFARFFRREAGEAPSRYRKRGSPRTDDRRRGPRGEGRLV